MGQVLWGPHWREALTNGLNVTKEEVDAWESDPDSTPADLERMSEDLGMVRQRDRAFAGANERDGIGR